MGIKSIEWAYKQDLSSSEKFVLVTLAHFMNDDTGLCFPSRETIAKRTGLNKDTVTKCFSSLRIKGLISFNKRFGGSYDFKLHLTEDTVNCKTSQLKNQLTEKPVNRKTSPKLTEKPVLQLTEKPVSNSNRTVIEQVNKKSRKASVTKPDGVPQDDWDEWNSLRNKKHLFLTTRALKSIEAEAVKAGKTLPEVISICLEHSWAGFKAEWLKNQSNNKQQPASVFDQFVVTNGYLKSKIEESKKEEADAQSLFGSFL